MHPLIYSILSYRPLIHRYLRSRTRSAEDAEDLTQEVLLRALQGAPALRSPQSMLPWMYSIARNQLYDYYRRAYRRYEVTLPEEEWKALDLEVDPKAEAQLRAVEAMVDLEALLSSAPRGTPQRDLACSCNRGTSISSRASK